MAATHASTLISSIKRIDLAFDLTHGEQALGAPESLGSALLGVLLERHGALPAEVECGLLAAAHACYEAGGCADALDVLVRLAACAAHSWALSGDSRPLVQLVAGALPHAVHPSRSPSWLTSRPAHQFPCCDRAVVL
jgi:hypothetical protein